MTEVETWALMTKSRGGAVSYIKGLTMEECKDLYVKLNPEHGRTYLQYEGMATTEWSVQFPPDSEIIERWVRGPEGWDDSEVASWDPWPVFEIVTREDPRWLKALGTYRRVTDANPNPRQRA